MRELEHRMEIFWVTQTDFDENLDIATWKEMGISLGAF